MSYSQCNMRTSILYEFTLHGLYSYEIGALAPQTTDAKSVKKNRLKRELGVRVMSHGDGFPHRNRCAASPASLASDNKSELNQLARMNSRVNSFEARYRL